MILFIVSSSSPPSSSSSFLIRFLLHYLLLLLIIFSSSSIFIILIISSSIFFSIIFIFFPFYPINCNSTKTCPVILTYFQLEGFSRKTEGLVHISQIRNERVNAVADIIKRGQRIKVKVSENNKRKN